MAEYLAPGVYIEELARGARPIVGVGTSTAGFVGETERGPVTPRLVTSWADYQRWYGGYVDSSSAASHYLPYAVRGFFENGGQRLFVARAVSATAATAHLDVPSAGTPLTVRALGPGTWGNNILLAVQPASASISAPVGSPQGKWFRLRVLYHRDGVPHPFVNPTDVTLHADANHKEPDAFEDFDNLSAASGEPNSATNVVNGNSRLIEIVSCAEPPIASAFPNLRLGGGTYVTAVPADYVGDAILDTEAKRGLAGLKAISEICLMAIPDEVLSDQLGAALLDACDALKDRFAILSAPLSGEPQGKETRPPRDCAFAAYYFPWVRVTAPHTSDGSKLVPATGHIAGVYARTDLERGVHTAPADEVVRGIVDHDLDEHRKPLSLTVGRQEEEVLISRGVNVIRDFRSHGQGIRIWGARTMASDELWKYVNVRRLFIFIEKSIKQGIQWVVFEPNGESTWIKVRASIEDFLRTVWMSGALTGRSPEESFFVKCDRSTMAQNDLDSGRLICVIGVAPVKPAEFVVIRICSPTRPANE